MAVRRIPLPRDSQPPEFASPNEVWLNRGLRTLASAADRVNAVTGAFPTSTSGTGGLTARGRSVEYARANNGDRYAAPHLSVGSSGDGSVLLLWQHSSTAIAGSDRAIANVGTDVTTAGFRIATNGTGSDTVYGQAYNTSVALVSITGPTLVDGQIYCTVLTAGTTLTLYHDGALIGTAAVSGGVRRTASAKTVGPGYLADVNVLLFAEFESLLTDQEAFALMRDPWQLFASQSIGAPVSAAGGAITTTASLDAAIQAAQTATASVSAAIQASRSGTADIAAAIQIARTLQASVDGAIQSGLTATAAASAAILQAITASSSLGAYIQAGSSLSASVDTAIQVSHSGTATLDAAIQRAVTATASLGAAVQAASTATASLNAYIQAGTSASATLDAAVQTARSATASLSVAISVARTAGASLGAAISVTSSVSAAVDAAVLASRSGQISLSAYISDPSVTDTNSAWWTYAVPADDLTYSVAADDLTYSIGTTTLAGAQT